MNTSFAIQRLIEVCRRQHKSLATERVYSLWLRDYCRFMVSVDPTLTSEKKVERFLTMLAQKRDVSASTQSQAFCALLFFYKCVLEKPLKNVDALRATRPDRIRYCPPRSEVMKLLPMVPNVGGYPTNLVTRLLYGCGLRVGEPIALRIKDVDLEKGKLSILGAKGGKDRVVALPCSLVEEIRQQMDFVRAIWRRDVLAKIPICLPHQLAKKYPVYQFSWPWAWLFPMQNPRHHPRTGEIVRWHLLACNVQRAVKTAADKLGVPVTPHSLRHSYASDCIANGTNIKALQSAMGHSNSDTTMQYVHADALGVKSPLEFS